MLKALSRTCLGQLAAYRAIHLLIPFASHQEYSFPPHLRRSIEYYRSTATPENRHEEEPVKERRSSSRQKDILQSETVIGAERREHKPADMPSS